MAGTPQKVSHPVFKYQEELSSAVSFDDNLRVTRPFPRKCGCGQARSRPAHVDRERQRLADYGTTTSAPFTSRTSSTVSEPFPMMAAAAALPFTHEVFVFSWT